MATDNREPTLVEVVGHADRDRASFRDWPWEDHNGAQSSYLPSPIKLRDYAATVMAAFNSVVEYLGGVWACRLRP
jgi:hypothetical protein